MDTDRKRFFVGDFTQFDKHSSWDAVSIGVSSGSVKVGYNDEVFPVSPEAEGRRTGWRRIFRFLTRE